MLHLSKVLQLLKFLPENYNLIQRIFTSFKNLHYDQSNEINSANNVGVMYTIHELRGNQSLIGLNEKDSITLIRLSSSIASSNSALDIIRDNFIITQEQRRKKSKTFPNLFAYLKWSMVDENSMINLKRQVLYNL